MAPPWDPETIALNLEHAATVSDPEYPTGVVPRQGSLVPATFPERYAPEALLGEGGMGAVVLFEDRLVGRRVAPKLMKPAAAGNPQLRDRFVREAQVQGQLEHPAIVPVYDMGVDPSGAPFFTMKRVRGVTLAEILDEQARGSATFAEKYPRRRLLTAFTSICLAVDFAHRLGVLHRDLKPANLMLGDFGEVYVLDWGVAKIQNAEDPKESAPAGEMRVRSSGRVETSAGIVLGTPGYMAPEQLRGEEDLGPAADVYALGAILFELLTMEPLNPGATPEAAIASTLTGAEARASVRAPRREVPPELEAVCVRATALDPADRFASARQLHDAVESWLGGELDVELRKKLATSHAKRGIEAALTARQAKDAAAEVEARREAMREIGRALALDPSNDDAAEAMMALLRQPPERLPPEVGAELERAEREKTRKVGRFGAVIYSTVAVYVPLLLWMGIRSPAVIAGFYLFAAAAAGLSAWAAASKRPSPRVVLGVMVVSNLAFALTATFFGPLFFMPGCVAINTAAFVAHAPREHRVIVVGTAVVAVLAPFLLQLGGILPPSYEFTPQGMLVLPGALGISAVPTTVFLAASALALVLVSALSVVQIRDALGDAERRLMVHSWHMREMASAPRARVANSAPPS